VGQTKAKVHDVFKDRIDELTKKAEEQAKAATGEGGRPWEIPNNYKRSVLEVSELHEPGYNRDEINTNYEEVLAAPKEKSGTLGDTISLKLQLAYVSAEERAFRLRHASPVRCYAHSIAAREGLGNSEGVFGGVQKLVDDAIQAGGS